MQNIKHILTEIEQKKNIKILYACKIAAGYGVSLAG